MSIDMEGLTGGLGRGYSVRLERACRRVAGVVTSPAFARTAAVAGVLLVAAAPVLAADSGGDPMPWEGPMDRFLQFFTGPFVRFAAVIAIVLIGVGMAFSENGTGMRKMTTAFFGLALAFGAATPPHAGLVVRRLLPRHRLQARGAEEQSSAPGHRDFVCCLSLLTHLALATAVIRFNRINGRFVFLGHAAS